jgi:hypothetical protein
MLKECLENIGEGLLRACISSIWNIGQKIAHILETLPQEETETTRKLIRQVL